MKHWSGAVKMVGLDAVDSNDETPFLIKVNIFFKIFIRTTQWPFDHQNPFHFDNFRYCPLIITPTFPFWY